MASSDLAAKLGVTTNTRAITSSGAYSNLIPANTINTGDKRGRRPRGNKSALGTPHTSVYLATTELKQISPMGIGWQPLRVLGVSTGAQGAATPPWSVSCPRTRASLTGLSSDQGRKAAGT